MGLFTKIFGTYSEREIKKISSIQKQVLELADQYKQMSEDELRGQTEIFKKRFAAGETLDDLLPEAFATVREASSRVLDMYHFPVQVLGGIILHQGRIAEMKTGEGKTLVATLPVYLNALSGKGVHVVTVNDYLAERDSEWMGKIYRYLGLSVGLVVRGLSKTEKQNAYNSDITYGTNNEFGFDYLRDNMVTSIEQLVQRELNFAIIDEVDSILVDEARTPLIISGSSGESSELYDQANQLIVGLKSKFFKETDSKLSYEERAELEGDADYIVDEKAKSAILTNRGVKKAESFFGLENLTDQENYIINHHINNALKAHGTMFRDQDYIVDNDEVIIVDDNTGRLMPGRRYSNGLHQAIEAKEHVAVKRESKTLATITFQNYFRMYNKLSGMTGTAMTEEDEFKEIYALDVVTIPTNEPMIREDLSDSVYKTESGKYSSLIEAVKEIHQTGQPILIGTISVEKSEVISALFTKAGIRHNVLNAKHHQREAEIVAQAGRLGAVTISTNMAGRGTDIMLGGNAEHMAKQEMRKQGYEEELIEEADSHNITDDQTVLDARDLFQELQNKFEAEIADEKEQVIASGGLYIIGTERHESRRIDNQLRGRSGRQGDPGSSKFYLSLEDDLLRLFGGERMETIFNTFGIESDMEIENPILTRTIESAQRRVEAQNFSIRKNVLQYDDVMNQQRDLIYSQRRQVLHGENVHAYFVKYIEDIIADNVNSFTMGTSNTAEWDLGNLVSRLKDLLGDLSSVDRLKNISGNASTQDLISEITEEALTTLENKKEDLGSEEILYQAERYILLNAVDNHWMEHIDVMDSLRDSIGMRGYAQHDPVVEYKREGYDMFEAMTIGIQEDAVRLIMRAQITVDQSKPMAGRGPRELSESRKGSHSALNLAKMAGAGGTRRATQQEPKQQPAKRKIMLGRNDPCWCGSGKKYKNCHLRTDEAN
ncbi:MAG: preprotein translocase subunit SecA [Clostridiaceae bacterium]|jgi:preprotein translocase subunit SecA|nr:preprotein translocase subunit SecA [Bacillota bacterium]NLN51656.1 preprotein translocase subunit SecA [Clostridiaceae bacterium]